MHHIDVMSKPTMMESSEDVVTANNTESPLRFRNDSSKHDEPAQKSFFTSAMSWIFPSSSSPTSAFDQTLDSAPVATEQPLVMVETEEQTAAILAKAIELAGPRPTDPVELAAYTSKVIDLVATIRAETQQEAKMNCPVRKLKLDFRMNLHQQDQDWIDKRKEFVEILKRLDRSPMDIFTEHFTEAQILYLIPPPKDNLILTIQKQHTKEYKMALGPEGPFRGVQDNLATKLTMLHFGMPIEPLTNNNLTHCADSDDKTNDPDDDSSAALAQRILFAEVPLEFLDKYDEGRSHGFPMLRKAKRRDPSASLATATPEPKTPTSALVSDGRAEAPLSVLGAATTPTGNGAGNDPIPTPASASSAQNSRLGQDRGYSRRPRNKAPSYRVHEPHFNPGQFTVSMRGGAGPDTVEDVDVETRMDQSSGENSSLTEEVYSNFIYGYNGKFLCENKMDSFKNAALRLLEYDFLTKPSWSFFVDIYPNENAKIPEKQLYVDGDAKLKMLWKGMKGHFHGPDKLGPWRVFVRNTGSHFSEGMLEPCRKGMKDIIRLIGPDNNQGNTTYWKIPKNTKLEYGINQCQPGFLRAMKMLYSHEPMPPQGHITLTFNDTVGSSGAHKFALAGGSMEATVQLWDAVSQEFANLNPDRNQTIDILVSCPSAPPLEPRQMTIHMVGSYITAGASFTDPEYTHNEIERTLNSYGGRPKSFRIWHAAEARDRGVPGKVIDFKPKELAIAKLKSFLHGWQGRTNCCWFSSEFTDFTVDALWDDGQVKQIAWSPGHGLASFRLALQNLVGQQEKLDSFTIVEAQSEVDGRRFVVTKNTSEREWRMHIYDWLTSNKLFVRKNANLDYLLSAHTFGSALAMKQPLTVNQKPTGQIEHAEGTTVAGAMEQTGAHRDHGLNATDRVAGGARPAAQTSNGQAGRTATMTSARPTRLNRERLVATVAGKPKSQKWADWMTEQHFQDDLQRRSWIKDQSVIEPGRMPAAPLFGPSRELQLGAGSSMPIVYAQHLTPSDIRQLQDENQKLRNQVLDRMAACLICDEEFETYDKDKIRGHMQHHHQQLKEAGRCPSCGEPQWAFMTNDEKRTHFAIHQVRNEGAKIKHFYEDQHCPVCDTDLSKMKPELVIAHCLNHAPGQVQYCDRCGLDEKDCNAEELRHHHHKCRLAKDRLVGDPVPFICTNCGADRTHETPEQNKHHQLHCRDRDPGRYCTKCGLNMTGPSWASADVIKHNQHCMPPSGFKKKYCQKCRAELFSLDTLGLSQHQQTCRLVEPVARSEQSRLTELKNRQFEARNLDALLSSRKAGIEARSKKQDDREAMLDARQKILDHKMSEHNDLYDQLQAAKKKGSSETDANQQTITEIFNGPTDCPYPQCATVIAAMNRVDLIKHLQRHMNIAPGFNCPLENAKGEKCNNHLSLKNDGFDLTVHYVHKLEDEQHAVLNQTVQDMGGEFRRLRDKVASAQPHFDSGVAFIHERQSDNKFQRISTGNAIIPPAAHQHDHGQDLHHIHEHGDHQHGQGQNPHHAHENEEHQHSHSQDPHHVDRHGVHHQQHQHDQRSAGETHNQNIATVKKTPSRAPKKPVDFPVSDATSTEAQPAAAGPAVTPLDVGAHAPIRPRLPRGVRDAERHTHQDDVAIKSYLSMISEDVEPEEDDPMRRNSVGIRPVVRRKPAAPNRKSYNESTAEILGGTGHGRRPSSLQKQIVDFGAERDTTSSSNKNILPDTTSKEDRASREDPVSTVSAAEKKRKQSGVDEEATASGNRAPAKKKPKKQKKVEEQVASPAKEPSKTVLTLPISQAGRSKSNAQEESEAVTESARRTRSSSRRATGNTTKR